MKDASITKKEKIELRSKLRKKIAEETDIKNLPDSVLFQDIHAEYDCKLLLTLLPIGNESFSKVAFEFLSACEFTSFFG